VAPAIGRVEQVVLKPGELANPSTTVLKLVDDTKLKVTIYVPQSQLSQVKVGQKVKVQTEGNIAATLGEIVFIASHGEFTPKNIQTQEQRATQVFAVKVALPGIKEGDFKPGQGVEVRLD
jgi:HlyD family secretion protein